MSIREQLSEERKKLQNEGSVPDWMTTDGWGLFKSKYAVNGEVGFKGRAETIARTLSKHSPDPEEYEKRFYNLLWKGWLSCSTPVLANTGTDRGMPVSCSGQYVGDSVFEFYDNLKESAVLSQEGFGTSGYLGDIRPRGSVISRGGKASGVLPVLEDFVTMSQKVSQGSNRRGAFAGYIDISHGDFDEVADYVKDHPDSANIGWCWYDSDTEKANLGDLEILRRFKKAMKLKLLTGRGYWFFPDKVNRANPEMYKSLNLKVKSSNLCSEIALYQDKDHTYTCVLSSMNLVHYNEWKGTSAVKDAIVFLDCVVSEFISKAKNTKGLEKAVRFTEKGRALGLGVCGFHTYLQQEMIPFESLTALFKNKEIFKHIKSESQFASMMLSEKLGEPEWCKGYGVRNTHLMCCPPTLSTSVIMSGVSQGIEPMIGNCFVQATAGGETERVNPVFLKLMKERNKFTRKLVKQIADNHGSVQDQDWISDEEKLVFKTAYEINQESIIRLASQRQPYVCQAQSINLFFSAEEKEEEIARIHRMAFEDENIKSLYYIRTQSGVKSSGSECLACM